MEEVKREVCSRPHLFLQRNLRRSIRKPLKKETKKNRRKRPREDCQGPCAAKQLRLNTQRQEVSNDVSHNNTVQPSRNSFTLNSHGLMSSTLSLESRKDSDLTLELLSLSTISEIDTLKTCTKQSVPKRGAGFKDLLAQLRGNSSMIIREATTEVPPQNCTLKYYNWHSQFLKVWEYLRSNKCICIILLHIKM